MPGEVYEESGPFSREDFERVLKWAANRKQSPHMTFITTREWRTEAELNAEKAQEVGRDLAQKISELARCQAWNVEDGEYDVSSAQSEVADAIAHLLTSEAVSDDVAGSYPWVMRALRAGSFLTKAGRSERWRVFDKDGMPYGPTIGVDVISTVRATPGVTQPDARRMIWEAETITSAQLFQERIAAGEMYVRFGTNTANILETGVRWAESLSEGKVVRLHCTNGMTVDVPHTQFSMFAMHAAL